MCRAALSTATGVMGSLRQQLVAGLLTLLLFGTLQAHAQTTVYAAATVADIQAKINAAPDNTAQTIIQIAGGIVRGTLPSGTTDMGSQWIKLDKRGVILRGSTDPSNPTIFQTNITTLATDGGGSMGTAAQNGSCLAQSEGIPFLQVCPAYAAGSAYPPSDPTAFPIIIENIIFKNTDSNPFVSPDGAEKGIFIITAGVSASNPSYVRNCQFLDLWRSPTNPGPSGIAIEFGTALQTTPKNWVIENNKFAGTKQGVFLNANDEVSIVNNSFTRFYTGVRQSSNDVSTGITITGNSFTGGWTNASSAPNVIQAIALSAAADTVNQNKDWLIEGNAISGVNMAFEIRWPSGSPVLNSSWVGMDINTNSIDANFSCPCANVYNTAPVVASMPDNWWGSETPDPTKFFSTQPGANVTVEPWITNFTSSTCSNGLGFCPTEVITNQMVVPVIVSVVVTPPLVSAGQSFLVTVTLEAPIPWGTLTFTSNPVGIICPVVHITSADNPIPVICTTPQATAVLSAGLLGTAQSSAAEQAAQVYADAVESSAEPAAPEAAVQVASQASVASSQQARVAQQQLSGSTAYTLTATVTADTVAEADADVQVCQNTPWPFRAAASGCRQCAYNCATGVFACTGCTCYCPKAQSLGNQVSTPGHTYKPGYNSYTKPGIGYNLPGKSSPDAYNQPGYVPEDKYEYDSQNSQPGYNSQGGSSPDAYNQPGYVPEDKYEYDSQNSEPGYNLPGKSSPDAYNQPSYAPEDKYDSQNRLDHGNYHQPDYGSEGQPDYGSYNQEGERSEGEPGYQSPDQSEHYQYRYEDQQGHGPEDKRGYEDNPDYDSYNQPTGYGSEDTPSSGSADKPDDNSYKAPRSGSKPSYESLEENDHDSYKQAGYGSEDPQGYDTSSKRGEGHEDMLLVGRDEFEYTHKASQHEDHETGRREEEEEEEDDKYGGKPHMHAEDGGRWHRSAEDSEYGKPSGETDVEHGDEEEYASSKAREPAYRDTGYKTAHVDAHGDEEEYASSKAREPAYRDTGYKTDHVDAHGYEEEYASPKTREPAYRDTGYKTDHVDDYGRSEYVYARRHSDTPGDREEAEHATSDALAQKDTHQRGDDSAEITTEEFRRGADSAEITTEESHGSGLAPSEVEEGTAGDSDDNHMERSGLAHEGGQQASEDPPESDTVKWLSQFRKKGSLANLMQQSSRSADGNRKLLSAEPGATTSSTDATTDGSSGMPFALRSSTMWQQPILSGPGYEADAQPSATEWQPDLVGAGDKTDAELSATEGQPDLVGKGNKADAEPSATEWQPDLVGPGNKADAEPSATEWQPDLVGAGDKTDAEPSATEGQPALVGPGNKADAEPSATEWQLDLVGAGDKTDAEPSATEGQPDLVGPGYKTDAHPSAAVWRPDLIGLGYNADAACSSQVLDCVCAPSPLVVGATCTGVTYDPCTNQLRCTNAATPWQPWYRY